VFYRCAATAVKAAIPCLNELILQDPYFNEDNFWQLSFLSAEKVLFNLAYQACVLDFSKFFCPK
jgi:hypothetical protein